MADDSGFLGRWSRRKQQARTGQPLEEPKPAPAPAERTHAAINSIAIQEPPASQPAPQAPVEPPLPTLEDAARLTPESDFAPFVARQVAPEVRNAAMKKLFADPHFNVMDMMDVYVDDYSRPAPIPEAALRQLASARFLDLFDEEKNRRAAMAGHGENLAPTGDVADLSPGQTVAQSPHDDPDLRLQPDDAPGPEGPGQRPE